MLAYRDRESSEAEEYLRQAVLYAPDYVPARQYYAMTLARLKQEGLSRQESERAAERDEEQHELSRGYILRSIP